MMEFGGNKVSMDKPRSIGTWVMVGLGIACLVTMFVTMVFVNKDTRRLAGVIPATTVILPENMRF